MSQPSHDSILPPPPGAQSKKQAPTWWRRTAVRPDTGGRCEHEPVPMVPAVCDMCRTMFPSGIHMGLGSGVRMVGNKSGPCPRCGSMGSIPDGYYEATSETELLRSSSLAELRDLQSVLDGLRAGRIDPSDAGQQLRKRPGAASQAIGKALANQQDRMELWTFLALILGIVAVLISLRSGDSTGPRATAPAEKPVDTPEPDLEGLVDEALTRCFGTSVLPTPTTTTTTPPQSSGATSGRYTPPGTSPRPGRKRR